MTKKYSILAWLGLLLVAQTAHAIEANTPTTFEAPPSPEEPLPIIVGIKAGDKAPFDGVIISPEAVATIIAEKEAAENKAMIEQQRVIEELHAEAKKNLDLLKIAKDADIATLKIEKDVAIKNNEQLTKALQKEIANRPNPVLLTGAGAAISAAIAVVVILIAK